jgi:hypothetical protein
VHDALDGELGVEEVELLEEDVPARAARRGVRNGKEVGVLVPPPKKKRTYRWLKVMVTSSGPTLETRILLALYDET